MNRCQKYLWSAKPCKSFGTTLPRPWQHPAKAVARSCQGRGTKQKSTMPVVHQLVENCR